MKCDDLKDGIGVDALFVRTIPYYEFPFVERSLLPVCNRLFQGVTLLPCYLEVTRFGVGYRRFGFVLVAN